MQVQRVGVIGGGIMGGGIAALFANERIPVTLFDLDREIAVKTIAQLKGATKLPQLTSPRNAKLIEPAATAEFAEKLGACDVIVEVVPEILSLKQKVMAEIDQHRKVGSVVSTNTSGLSIAKIIDGRSEDLRAHFLGTHYFHPVRYMPLVELIPGPDTAPAVLEAYDAFFTQIGKRPVLGRDTPNFIANRVGVFQMLEIMALTERYGLSFEEVDLVTGPPLGMPKTATYRLGDMVGLDTLLHASTNSYENCPEDERREAQQPPALLKKLVEAKLLGEKTGKGFYWKAGKGDIRTLDPATFEYRAQQKPSSAAVDAAKGERDPLQRIAKVCGTEGDKVAEFARHLIVSAGSYALHRVGEIAEDIRTIDDAMRWGFGRDVGPIRSLDALGLERSKELMQQYDLPVPPLLDAMIDAGATSIYGEGEQGDPTVFDAEAKAHVLIPHDPEAIEIARLVRRGAVQSETQGGRLVDLGDGVLLCELRSVFVPSMNPVDDAMLDALQAAHDAISEGRFKALVIGNQQPHFCAGANLKAVLELAKAKEFDKIDALAKRLQDLNLRGLHADYPVVAAPHGMTLGGGLEIALGAQVRVARSELYAGLVEVGVGLVPAGGGCLRLLQAFNAKRNLRGRPLGPMQNALAAFDLIAYGKTSSSALDAKEKGLLIKGDVIEPNQDRLVRKAKEVALARLENFEAIPETPVAQAGNGGYLVMLDTIDTLVRVGQLPPHAATIARVQAKILSGGPSADPMSPSSEADILAAERAGFVELVQTPQTQERMLHMLKTGKPLMN